MSRLIRCFAEEHGGKWEAICIDLDVAVQASSFQEIYRELNAAVAIYLETVLALPDDRDRERLLNRTAPFGVRWKYFLRMLQHWLRGDGSSDSGQRAQFTMLRPA